MTVIHAIETIISDPEIRNGQPVIAGTSVRVKDIAASHIYRGLSAEELAANFMLDMGQVHAALAYYYQHKVELDEQMRADAKKAETMIERLAEQGKLLRLE